MFWPFLRSSTRAPTTKAIGETIAIKGVFENQKGRPFPLRERVPLTGPLATPDGGDAFLYGPLL